MYSFLNDYNETSHEIFLNEITKQNLVQTVGYGEDEFCQRAKEFIQEKFKCPDADVKFFIGGTATNLAVLSYILRPWEAAITVDTGHINVHEGGAIEATGHKVLTVKNIKGKIDLKEAQKILDQHFEDDHMVMPKALYISNATEMGTVYTLGELKKMREFCDKNGLYLYLDGARLAQALTSKYSDIKPEDLSKYTDLFYIGGTKNGAPIGEALVINNKSLVKDIIRHMKQKGTILAKGKILGIIFSEFFKGNLFFELGQKANRMAEKIYDSLKDLDFKFTERVESNQIFMELSNEEIGKLKEKYAFSVQDRIDEDTRMIRLVTSWATDEKQVDDLIEDMKSLKK